MLRAWRREAARLRLRAACHRGGGLLPARAAHVDLCLWSSAEGAGAGKLHGYGFVQFATQEAAGKACQLHGADFMGRELTVDVATAADGGKAATGTPVEGCWFCLSNPNADVNLVASIGTPPCIITKVAVFPISMQTQIWGPA